MRMVSEGQPEEDENGTEDRTSDETYELATEDSLLTGSGGLWSRGLHAPKLLRSANLRTRIRAREPKASGRLCEAKPSFTCEAKPSNAWGPWNTFS